MKSLKDELKSKVGKPIIHTFVFKFSSMHFKILILFYLCLGFKAGAQINSDPEVLIGKAHELTDTNPGQAIKIGQHLLKSPLSDSELSDVQFLIAKGWFSKGQFVPSLTAAFRAKQLAATSKSNQKQATISILIATVLRTLQLEDESEKYLKVAAQELKASKKSDESNMLFIRYLNIKALLDLHHNNYDTALARISEAKKIATKLPKDNQKVLSEIVLAEGEIYLSQKQYDLAAISFSKSLELLEKNNKNSLPYATVLNEIATVYFQQKQHQKAVDLLLTALPISERLQHMPLQESINKQLAFNCLALKNRERYHFYNQKYLEVSDAVDNLESESTNVAFNLISREQELDLIAEEEEFAKYLYISLGIVVLVIGCFTVLYFRNKARVNHFQEIRNYLELGLKSTQAIAIETKKEPAKNLVIPVETEQNILAKLKKFEASTRFTNKEMSLAVLAAQFDTNTKYLSEIINKHSNDNFNTYINKLRIAYIIEKIKNEPNYRNYKISYLAAESGFSSHSSFATIFKSITGIAPTTFIEFVKEEVATNKGER